MSLHTLSSEVEDAYGRAVLRLRRWSDLVPGGRLHAKV